ncbi:M4 family metallopeptidase [Streptomyces sp. AN091965]|uniref:M4 family metallopeptidase n=1 Tax=Streptomyces sp. AN091965 TaxID=2927803 RepID=UPI001F617BEB|nr:M4 family metallopeptidase [Streptomyces sp. AN091965]MCI3929652.1 M4 family metallopeptidase [Streptomyces sp. AN091965]
MSKSRRRARISGGAALLGAAALLASGVPAAQAADETPQGPATEVVPGTGTKTPALVDGIEEAAKDSGSPAAAARGHLAAKKDRYEIADPARNLTAEQTLKQGDDETVRFQQKHRGLPVLGGQYLVRMEKKDGDRVVTGTSGKYFTGLTVGTRAHVAEKTAVERAVAATGAGDGRSGSLTKLSPRPDRTRAGAKAKARTEGGRKPELTGASHGLVVLPRGKGVLTYHVTVTGTDPVSGAPVKQEVYVDAASGFPVLQYSGIQSIADDADFPGTTGSGVKLDGKKVDLDLTHDAASDAYQLRDHRRQWDGSKNALTTWDARGVDANDASGRWPSGIGEVASKTKEFGKDATESGAVDAHWAAGQVYDYYKKKHGRDSLDGKGMAINSLVGVTDGGFPFVNAFWDGQKMVYGGGDEETKTLSADLDVVGHEMTHGVVEHTAGLVYVGQSGALNEAVADYFGNAIDVTASKTPMSDPKAALIGEDLCRTKAPEDCAFRNLNDGRTTAKDFLGVTIGTDSGGVHLNSTIFSGALWDIREDLGGTLADRIVYKALAEYLTPLDGYTDARNAVVAAAKALGVKGAKLRSVNRAFDAHGITKGWEKAIGADSDKLLGDVNATRLGGGLPNTGAGAGGGWWATSKSDDEGQEAFSVWAGRTDGKGTKKLISPNDGRYHVYPDTDGRTVAWVAYGPTSVEVLSRPLTGGPVKKLWSAGTTVANVHVSGQTVTWQESSPHGQQRVAYLRKGEREPVFVDGGRYDVATALPTLSGDKLGYAKVYVDKDGHQQVSTEITDVRTGKHTLVPAKGAYLGIATPAINGTYLYWLVDDIADDNRMGLRRANLDGTGLTDVIPESSATAYFWNVDASDSAVTLTQWRPQRGWSNGNLTKLVQTDLDGKGLKRVSCNRGEQTGHAADTGKRVVWIDGTTGRTDLVTRARPAGTC